MSIPQLIQKGTWRFYNITKGSLAPKAKSSVTSYLASSGAEYLYFCSSRWCQDSIIVSEDNHIIQLYRNSYASTDPKVAAKWEVTDISQQANLRNVQPEGNSVFFLFILKENSFVGQYSILCTFFSTRTMVIFMVASFSDFLKYLELYCIHNLPYVPKSGWHHRNITLEVFGPLAETTTSEFTVETNREVIGFEGLFSSQNSMTLRWKRRLELPNALS